MRHRYIVTYDIADPRRLRRVFKRMKAYGESLQLSVFRCDLSEVQRVNMIGDLRKLINQREDKVMIVDLGPTEGTAQQSITFLGVHAPDDGLPVTIIV